MFRPLVAIAIAASTLLAQAGTHHVHAQAPRDSLSKPAPTLFGQGPELYVSPTWGTIGTRVSVVGLGYQPGRAVAISLLPYDPWASLPLGSCLGAIRAHATVRADGTLHATFVVPRQEAPLLRGQARFTLDVRTIYGRGCAAGERPVGSHALFVLMSAAFAPGSWWGR